MSIEIPSDRLQDRIAFEFLEDKFGTEHKILLDVGCSDRLLEPFLPKNIKYNCLDVRQWGEVRPEFLVDLDKKKIPVEKNFFDFITCLETLEHTQRPKKVLKEILRISKKDSQYVFSLPNEYNFLLRIYYLLGIKKEMEEPWEVVNKHLHIHKPRIKDIFNLLSEDFNIKKVKYQWYSRKSKNSKFFKIIDFCINSFAQIIPNLFARDVVLLCERRRWKE